MVVPIRWRYEARTALVTGAIKSRETGERKLLDDTTRRAISSRFPGRTGSRRAGRSACTAEGRRTSRLRGTDHQLRERSQSAIEVGYAMADSRFLSRTFQPLISGPARETVDMGAGSIFLRVPS